MLEMLQLKYHKIHKFRPKIEIYSDKGPLILKTVTESEELVQALRLRYQVFHREMIGKIKPRGIDVDDFDLLCDHLIIKDKKTDTVVGTYRLNCSSFSQRFYSAGEFNLRKILETPGPKLELGRACIHKDYRRGFVIALLWRGIAEYMAATDSKLLFGCASIKTTSPRQAAVVYHYFRQQGLFKPEFLAPPTLNFAMPGLDLWISNLSRPLSADEVTEAEALVPALCNSYIKAGASLGGEPAYDEEFKCIDFLTILPRENLNKTLWRKYNSCETQAPTPAPTQVHQTPLYFPAAMS